MSATLANYNEHHQENVLPTIPTGQHLDKKLLDLVLDLLNLATELTSLVGGNGAKYEKSKVINPELN